MQGALPRWNISVNPARAYALSKAARAGQLWPLDELVTMHAGEVVDLPAAKVDAFYAQNWAFARFLLEAEGGRYRPKLQRWLADTAAGTVYDPGGTLRTPGKAWDSSGTRAVLEHYLGEDFASIERAYAAYVAQLTDSFPALIVGTPSS